MKQIPSADLFIIHADDGNKDEVSRRLASLGIVQDLKGSDAQLLHFVGEKPEDSRTAWKHAQAKLGHIGNIQPVLFDERGDPHYPTGEVSVRFDKPLSDEQLQRFATDYQLRLRRRNEYVPEQAVFYPAEPEKSYIPDLVQKIADAKDAKVVWANTSSHYERLQKRA